MPACRDCAEQGITTRRPAPHPGPRCSTHWRSIIKQRKAIAHQKHVERTYGITPEEYDALIAGQGGICFICRRSRGLSRRLAVDHDHKKGCGHDPATGCRDCVRALLCQQCNRIVIGRYSTESLTRAIEVLTDPPAQKILKAQGPQANTGA